MPCTIEIVGYRDQDIDSVVESLKDALVGIEKTLDADIKGAISGSDIDIEKRDKYVFCTVGNIGVSICSGHIDGVFAKLFRAYSLYRSGEISSLVLIAKTATEAWWNNQEAQNKKGMPLTLSDGNRQNWDKARKAIESAEHWYDLPITAIIIEREVSSKGFSYFKEDRAAKKEFWT